MEYYELIIIIVGAAVVAVLEHRRDHRDAEILQRLAALEHMVGSVYSPLLLHRVEQLEKGSLE